MSRDLLERKGSDFKRVSNSFWYRFQRKVMKRFEFMIDIIIDIYATSKYLVSRIEYLITHCITLKKALLNLESFLVESSNLLLGAREREKERQQ